MINRAAIAAATVAAGQPGLLGLPLEGPHFDPRRKGTHDPALIRPMQDDDLAVLVDAARALPHLICTLAPEAVRTDQIAALAQGDTAWLGPGLRRRHGLEGAGELLLVQVQWPGQVNADAAPG